MSLISRLIMVAIVLIALAIALDVKADYYDYKSEPDYQPYGKISLGYILNQPSSVINRGTGKTIELFQGDHLNYSMELGLNIKVPESNREFHLGLAFVDLLNQGESSENYSPYKFEVFGDYIFNFSSGYYTSIGVGFKIASDNRVVTKRSDPNFLTEEEYFTVNESYLDKLTARFSIGKKFKYYTLSIDHHSQWLAGQPFNDDFEYYVTSLNISYTF